MEVICRVCGDTYTGRGMTRHLKACLAPAEAERRSGLHLRVWHHRTGARPWLQLLVDEAITLHRLDLFFRQLWFGGGQPLSQFEVDGRLYEPPHTMRYRHRRDGRTSADLALVDALGGEAADQCQWIGAIAQASQRRVGIRCFGRHGWPSSLIVASPDAADDLVVLSRSRPEIRLVG